MANSEFDEIISSKLELELKCDALEHENSLLNEKLKNLSAQYGQQTIELKILQVKSIEREKKFQQIKKNEIADGKFAEYSNELIKFLVQQRKLSQDENQRKNFQEFAEMLGKMNELSQIK